MSKKMVKKSSKSSSKDSMSEETFRKEMIYAVHLLKYNLYLLSKSLVLNTLLEHLPKAADGSPDLNKAVGLSHGILEAFHKQDHPELVEKAKEQQSQPPTKDTE